MKKDQVIEQPRTVPETKILAHGYCLYLPGEVEGGRPAQFLLDTGASENVLAKAKFNELLSRVKERLVPNQQTASMADGSRLLMYSSTTLTSRIRSMPQEITFLLANISEDAILGMTFFATNRR